MDSRYSTLTIAKKLKRDLKILSAKKGISISKLIQELYDRRAQD